MPRPLIIPTCKRPYMLHPEASEYARTGPGNAPFGNDLNFSRNPCSTNASFPWRASPGPLGGRAKSPMIARETVEMARPLGYR